MTTFTERSGIVLPHDLSGLIFYKTHEVDTHTGSAHEDESFRRDQLELTFSNMRST